jgi:hypothetical protein
MTGADHNKILATGFAAFAVIFFCTFLLLLLVTTGVFVALGTSLAKETGDDKQVGIGILGGIVTVIFYAVLGLICVLPTALASWKMFKGRMKARLWATIAVIVVLPVFPLGTVLGIYGLWFLFSAEGRRFYLTTHKVAGEIP